MLDAYGLLDAPTAHWQSILPGPGLRFILQLASYHQLPARWFSPIGWRDSRYWLKYGAATVYVTLWMRLLGLRVPWPRVTRFSQADRIARWMRDMLDQHGRCLLMTSVSAAMRVCLAARQAGFDLARAVMLVGAEPMTPARARVFESVGVRLCPVYASIEAGIMAFGCLTPHSPDELHFASDAFALVSFPHFVPNANATVPAFNLTSLLTSSSKILLNFECDDYGLVETRTCGCAFEAAGYCAHLREIRSYSKLVGEGVTLVGNDMLHILETVLPARFGGSPLDYQLVEQEDAQGFARLVLVISPRIDVPDEQEAIAVVLNALGAAHPSADAARSIWQQAGSLQVRRAEPRVTARGKFLPLHIERNV
jgi:hypothetical protein